MENNSLDGAKKAIEIVILLDRLMPVIGISGLLGAAYGFWARLKAMNPVHAGLAALAAMVLCVLLINGIRAYLKHRTEALFKGALRVWALSDSFNIGDAAVILARSRNQDVVHPYLRTLKDWAASGRLIATPDAKGEFSIWARVTKAELRKVGPEFGRNDPFEW